jgi:uncharacterized membrane protein YebE (DUF533 family)
MPEFNKTEMLARLGLEPRTSPLQTTLTVLGTLGLGAMIGAGIALLLAPKSGKELRQDLSDKVGLDTLASHVDGKLSSSPSHAHHRP